MTRAQGIDVSRYQITTPPLTGRDFLIARATFGLGIDTMYKTHIANARKAGLVVGAYAFGYDFIDSVQQADAFLAAAGDVDLYFLDVEGKDAQTPAQAQRFIDRVRSKGKRCGLYMSESGFYSTLTVDYRWVANWTREPKIRWDFWQKRGSPLDLDEYHGTAAELRAFVGIPPAPPSDVETALDVVQPGRKLTAFGGRAILSKPIQDSQYLLRNTVAGGEGLRILGNSDPDGWQLVESLPGAPNPVRGWIRNEVTTDFRDGGECPPATDCTAAVKAATDPLKAQLAAETARANAAESRVNNAKTALGCA